VERQRGMLQVVDVRSSKRGCGGRHGRWQVLDVRKKSKSGCGGRHGRWQVVDVRNKKQERLRWQARAVAGGRWERRQGRAVAGGR
jgi:hypothetical protein